MNHRWFGDLNAHWNHDEHRGRRRAEGPMADKTTSNAHRILPVLSCFGGLAVYRGARFFEPSCSYTYDKVPELYIPASYHASLNDPCEHVALHLCLAERGTTQRDGDFTAAAAAQELPSEANKADHRRFRAGIVTSMVSWWSGS